MKRIHLVFQLLGFVLGGYYALWLPKLLERGFSVADVASLIALRVAVSTICDLPFGMLADRSGHKRITLTGFAVLLFALLFPSLSASPMALAGAVLLMGVGEALINGALDSWAADIQAHEGKGTEVRHFVSRDQSQRIGMIAGSLVIPAVVTFLAHEQARLTWAIYLGPILLLLYIATTLPAFRVVGTAEEPALPLTSRSIVPLFRDSSFLFLCMGWFFFGISDGAVEVTFLPRMSEEFGITSSIVFGFIQAGLSVTRLVGSELWKRSRAIESALIPAAGVLGSSLFFLLFALSNTPALALVSWCGRVLILSVYFSTMIAVVMRSEAYRGRTATILSVSSLLIAAGKIALTSGAGLLAEPAEWLRGIAVLGAMCAMASGGLLAAGLRQIPGQAPVKR